jgi:putative PIN family toxin of toxin-antitoxin system
MKIVLDTNVLVSGLLTPFGPCGKIVRMVSAGKLILYIDARILSEYNEVLQRPKFKFNNDHIDTLISCNSSATKSLRH